MLVIRGANITRQSMGASMIPRMYPLTSSPMFFMRLPMSDQNLVKCECYFPSHLSDVKSN